MFFAETQNKLLYAVTSLTAAELISQRADAKAPNMNPQSWKGSVVHKTDITIAKMQMPIVGAREGQPGHSSYRHADLNVVACCGVISPIASPFEPSNSIPHPMTIRP